MEGKPTDNSAPQRPSSLKKFGDYLMVTQEVKLTLPLNLIKFITLFVLIIYLIITLPILASGFENKPYDPYGQGIRFFQARDDTGAVNSNMYERRTMATPQTKISPLTSAPEPPHFSEGYNIDAKIENGSVMLERENFENAPLNLEDLERANKGL